jgi:hypothetical protein
MAITPLHELLTRQAMREFGFLDGAIEIAAKANAAVDTKEGNQGKRPEVANLHAMVGEGQTREQAVTAVRKILDDAKDAAALAVVDGRYREALTIMGAALHTVQDRAYHRFEEWPYDGISEALLKDPMYMFAHGVRDLGCIGSVPFGVSRLGFSQAPGGPRFDLQLSVPVWRNTWINLGGFAGPSPTRGLGIRDGMSGMEPLGSGGMLTVSFGAAPGSLPSAVPKSQLEQIVTQGPGAQSSALEASVEFLRGVQKEADARERQISESHAGSWMNCLTASY